MGDPPSHPVETSREVDAAMVALLLGIWAPPFFF